MTTTNSSADDRFAADIRIENFKLLWCSWGTKFKSRSHGVRSTHPYFKSMRN